MGPGGILPFGNGPKSNDFAQFSPGAEMFVLINPGSRRNANPPRLGPSSTPARSGSETSP